LVTKFSEYLGEFDEEETSCCEQLSQLEEAIQSDRRSLEDASNKLMEQEGKMVSVRTRIEIIKKNVQIAGEEVKDALLKLVEFGRQKKMILKRKMEAEFELRAQKCKALVFDLIAPDAVEEDLQERVAAVQKKVKDLEIELGEIEKELGVLKEEEDALIENLEYAEEFPTIGASRWLSIMLTELNEFESAWKEDVNSLNQMVDSSKERIQVYNQLEERLLKIDFVRKMAHLSEKKSSLMLSLGQIQLDDNADGVVDNTTSTNKSSFLYAVGLLPV